MSLTEKPEPHPQPEKLDSISLPLYSISAGLQLFRIHKNIGRNNERRSAVYFDRSDRSRFNAPAGEYGILYAASDSYAAFRETVRVYSSTPIAQDFLEPNCLSVVFSSRDLRLVDLSGAGLTKIGADARLTTGNYSLAQTWSQALYNHHDKVDGLYYRSRFDPSRFCIALYDRDRVSGSDLQETRITENNLLDRSFESQLKEIFYEYGYERDDTDNPSI